MLERTESNFIRTFTGRKFWPLNPRPEDIHIQDIAHALSLKNRYAGHTRKFYSVAQHSHHIALQLLNGSWSMENMALVLWGLLHDASEAYLGDIVSPIKPHVSICGEPYKTVEERLLKMIIEKYNLEWPEPPEVKAVDILIRNNEKRDQMNGSDIGDKSVIDALEITSWSPESAENYFINLFNDLRPIHNQATR